MMKRLYPYGYLICIVFGMLWFSWLNEIILFRWPSKKKNLHIQKIIPIEKSITIYFWKHESWHQESTHVIWVNDIAENIKALTNQWIKVLVDESIIVKQISVQTVLMADSELFISFNNNLFDPIKSTFEKWMIMESCLKTLYPYISHFSNIRFLVHHKPMQDRHLDFSHSWPKEGYFEKNK